MKLYFSLEHPKMAIYVFSNDVVDVNLDIYFLMFALKMIAFLNSKFILSTFIQYFTMILIYVVFLYSTSPMNQRLFHLEKFYLFQTCTKRLRFYTSPHYQSGNM
jgi:hypothetical protein